MSHKKIALLGASLLLASTSCQMVANGPQLTTGMQRSAVGLGYEDSTTSAPGFTDLETTSMLINVSHGWFVAENIELGGKLIYQGTEADDGVTKSEADAYSLAAFGRVYFEGGTNLYPYVEGLFGVGNVDQGFADDNFATFSIGAGVMNFVTSSTALDAIIKYQKVSFDEADLEVDGVLLEVAYSVFW